MYYFTTSSIEFRNKVSGFSLMDGDSKIGSRGEK
jgi:hypothetical protein